MRSSAVTFRGSRQVLEAYRANDMCAWAICNGKEIMFADEPETIEDGEAMLEGLFKKLQTGGSRAVFTLRVYELTAKEKIKSNTPHSRAFNFALYDDEEEYSPYEHGRRTYAREADEKIEALQKKVDLLTDQLAESEESEAEGVGGIEGFISGIIRDPMMKQTLINAVAGIVRKIVPMQTTMPAAVAGIGDGQAQAPLQSVLEPGQPEKVQQAVNILCTQDPLLGDHLLKVAAIAMNNPQQYRMLIGML